MSKNHSIVIKKGFFFSTFASFEISQVKGDRKNFIHRKAASNIFRVMPLNGEREGHLRERKQVCLEEKRSRMTTGDEFSHAFFFQSHTEKKRNETGETETASQVFSSCFFSFSSWR